MLAGLTGFHLLILVGVVVLLFGASKLPVLAKNLGSSAKILRSELHSMQDDEPSTPRTDASADPQPVAVPVVPEAATQPRRAS